MSDDSGSGGGCGCLSLVLFLLLAWALMFGVTVNGTHYGLSCSCSDGVNIQGGDSE